MSKKISVIYSPWQPNKPSSKGATAYHDAVVNSSWHIKNIDGLIKIISKKIKDGDIVVDFGAGTGASAYYILKYAKNNFTLWLVDNSPSWLGKAYELFNTRQNILFSLLEKTEERYHTLEETIGTQTADHIISANTFHLIQNLKDTFKGIYNALKPGGTFTFQSGSIIRNGRKNGILILDNTVNMVHDIALDIIRKNDSYAKYRTRLSSRIKQEKKQRKFVFPDPRPIEYYISMLDKAGFKNPKVTYKHIHVHYKDWLAFLLVRRLQAGILPEVGGKEATKEEEIDRNELIKMATLKLFKKLKKENTFASNVYFTAEWIYVKVDK